MEGGSKKRSKKRTKFEDTVMATLDLMQLGEVFTVVIRRVDITSKALMDLRADVEESKMSIQQSC